MLQSAVLPLPKGAAAILLEPIEAKPGRSLFFDQRTMALDECAPAAEPPVVGDELRMRQGVAVQEYQVFAPRPGDGLVENAGPAEALVGLPDVFGAQALRRRPLGEDLPHRLARTIVGQQNLLGRGGLPRDRGQHSAQVIRLLKAIDDETDSGLHSTQGSGSGFGLRPPAPWRSVSTSKTNSARRCKSPATHPGSPGAIHRPAPAATRGGRPTGRIRLSGHRSPVS